MKKFLEIIGLILTFAGILLIPATALTIELHNPVISGITLVAALLAMVLGALAIHKTTELD